MLQRTLREEKAEKAAKRPEEATAAVGKGDRNERHGGNVGARKVPGSRPRITQESER